MRNHSAAITLSPLNSGATIYKPQPRGNNTFLSIDQYPFDYWENKRGPEDAVVELVVDYAVKDISDLVTAVDERHGPDIITRIYRR